MPITRSDIDDVVLFCTKLGAVPMPKLVLQKKDGRLLVATLLSTRA